MDNRINKIPPLTGSTDAKVEQLRREINRMADEYIRLLSERDREIARLRKEIAKNESK